MKKKVKFKKDNKPKMTVTIDKNVLEAVQRASESQGRSVSNFVERSLQSVLDGSE